MAKNKAATQKKVDSGFKEAILKSVGDLLNQHEKEIIETLNDSETSKVTVNLGAELDFSETEAVVKTKIRFSSSVTDMRVCKLGDPDQIQLFGSAEELKKSTQVDLAARQEAGEPVESSDKPEDEE